jgi:hypothetical protein
MMISLVHRGQHLRIMTVDIPVVRVRVILTVQDPIKPPMHTCRKVEAVRKPVAKQHQRTRQQQAFEKSLPIFVFYRIHAWIIGDTASQFIYADSV